MGEKEKKEESWLQRLCGDDPRLFDVLSSSLYFNPIAALPKDDLGALIEASDKSVKDEDYEEAIRKYRWVLDKAIFEATRHQEEKDRYIKLIQDLLSKSTQVMEKANEKAEKEGRSNRLGSIGRGTEYCRFVSERIEDFLEIARHFYDERLEMLGEEGRGEARVVERREKRRKEEKREGKRDRMGEKERREKIAEEDREEERERQREKEAGEARRKKIVEVRK